LIQVEEFARVAQDGFNFRHDQSQFPDPVHCCMEEFPEAVFVGGKANFG